MDIILVIKIKVVKLLGYSVDRLSYLHCLRETALSEEPHDSTLSRRGNFKVVFRIRRRQPDFFAQLL